MTELTTIDLADADAVARRRDEIVAAVRDHAGRIAYALARLHDDDDGRRAFTTDAGEWTVAYEAGDLQYLRFSPRSGSEMYPVSTKRPPEPGALTTAMADYSAFVAAYDDRVRSLDGRLDGVETDFPTIASTDGVVAERDRIVARVREVADVMAGELQRYEGTDYGTFAKRSSGPAGS